jgi:hypothetical protein
MKPWAILLGGLGVWAAHFLAVYLIASLFPGSPAARWLTVAATAAALPADGAILWIALRSRAGELESWIGELGAVGAALSLVAVLWQGSPGLLL